MLPSRQRCNSSETESVPLSNGLRMRWLVYIALKSALMLPATDIRYTFGRCSLLCPECCLTKLHAYPLRHLELNSLINMATCNAYNS